MSVETHFVICPSRKSTELIWDRKSASCVVGVYVEAALGTRTGVVGSDAILLCVYLVCVVIYAQLLVERLRLAIEYSRAQCLLLLCPLASVLP